MRKKYLIGYGIEHDRISDVFEQFREPSFYFEYEIPAYIVVVVVVMQYDAKQSLSSFQAE